MKKILSLILSIVLLFSFGAILTGCNDDSECSSTHSSTPSSVPSYGNHTHTFEDKWSHNENGHYKACICHPEVIILSDHLDSTDRDGICNLCNYVIMPETAFTVTVKDNQGNKVEGVEIKIFSSSFEHTAKTDSDGVVSYTAVYYDNVKALVISVPEGYVDNSSPIHQFIGSDLEIVIDKK